MQEEQRFWKDPGNLVFLGLAVLTGLEFMIAALDLQWWSAFLGIGAVKAWLVIRYFMHFPRLFAEEKADHDR